MKRTMLWLGEKDREAIRIIRAKYGQRSNSAAMRFALRVLASHELQIQGVVDAALVKDG